MATVFVVPWEEMLRSPIGLLCIMRSKWADAIDKISLWFRVISSGLCDAQEKCMEILQDGNNESNLNTNKKKVQLKPKEG